MSAHGAETNFPDFVDEVVGEFLTQGGWAVPEATRARVISRIVECEHALRAEFDGYRVESIRCEDSKQFWTTNAAKLFMPSDGEPGALALLGWFLTLAWAVAVYFQPGFVPAGATVLAHWYYPVVFLFVVVGISMLLGNLLGLSHSRRKTKCSAARSRLRAIIDGEVRRLLLDPSMALIGRYQSEHVLRRPFIFVLCPFPGVSGDGRSFFTTTLFSLVREVAGQAGMQCYLAQDVLSPGLVLDTVMNGVGNAELVIADVSEPNLNVYYEIGLAHGLQKEVILLTSSTPKDLPFDLAVNRVLRYSRDHVDRLREDLIGSVSQWQTRTGGPLGRGLTRKG